MLVCPCYTHTLTHPPGTTAAVKYHNIALKAINLLLLRRTKVPPSNPDAALTHFSPSAHSTGDTRLADDTGLFVSQCLTGKRAAITARAVRDLGALTLYFLTVLRQVATKSR